MNTITKIILPAGIVILGLAAMFFFISMKEDSPRKSPTPRTKFVEVEIVDLQPVSAEINTYGRISSAQPVQLVSEVTGELMPGDISFRPAENFKRGQLLIKIDDRPALLNLKSRKSEFLNALSNALPEIKVEFPDEYPIWLEFFNTCDFDKPLDDIPETDNMKIKLYLSRFNVYQLYYSIRDMEVDLENYYFYAPFDGAIVAADYQVGANARNGTVLGRIINLENMELEVQIPVQDLGWIDYNRPVEFNSRELGLSRQGIIKRTGSSLDEKTQTVPVYIGIEDIRPGQLINGIFADALVPGKIVEQAYMIPHQAIYGNNSVYLIENGALVMREVNIARKESNFAIVDDGLENGDTLVVEVMQGAAPGMPAKPSNLSIER